MKGLLNPKNQKEGGGGSFQEGNVEVKEASFIVFQPKAGEGQPERNPFVALLWKVARLDEELEPLRNDDEEPVTEDLVFSFGKSSLAFIHPASASGPDDEETEDQGDEPGTIGSTLHEVKPFALNSKAGVAFLMNSLKKAGWKEDYLDRVWAPDYVGLVAHMKTEYGDKMTGTDGVERPIPYKTVSKIHRAPYESKAKKGAAESKVSAAESAFGAIIAKLKESSNGEGMSLKALRTRISGETSKPKFDSKLMVPVNTLARDDKWLAKNAAKLGLEIDFEENQVTFGD